MKMDNKPKSLPVKTILKTWWPLALSWLLMALELPALSSIVSRLADPKINLAAYGGIVFPLALIIEAPIIMLLAASTALSKDWDSYQKIRKFMHYTSAALTALHILVVSTPLYFFITRNLIGSPEEIILPARYGLAIMLPWTWSIAYRRFNQGVLIRFGHTRVVSQGTFVRLLADILVLALGYWLGNIPGIVVATSAVAAGVVSEALYIGIKVKPALEELKEQPISDPVLTRSAFLKYYIPLALTSLITLISQPLISTALSRMPRALDSLAVWPVLSGLLFLFRSPGIAYNEVVVSLLDEPGSYHPLKKIAQYIALASTVLLLVVVSTPASRIWLISITSLPESLYPLARTALWFCLLVPGANTFQSWFQGILLNKGITKGIPEAVAVFLFSTIIIYLIGIITAKFPGIYIGTLGFSVGMILQTIWLKRKTRLATSVPQAVS